MRRLLVRLALSLLLASVGCSGESPEPESAELTVVNEANATYTVHVDYARDGASVERNWTVTVAPDDRRRVGNLSGTGTLSVEVRAENGTVVDTARRDVGPGTAAVRLFVGRRGDVTVGRIAA